MADELRISRRRFLGAMGAGAGAVVVPPGGAVAAPRGPARAVRGPAAARFDAFGRIFRLPPFADPTPRVKSALLALGAPGGLLDARDAVQAGPVALIADPALSANNPNNPSHTAGTTFFGQFIDHDITFDASSRLGYA